MVQESTKQKILNFIQDWFRTHDYSPSVREIADFYGYSTSTVNYSIEELIEDGLIVRKAGATRTLRLLIPGQRRIPLRGSIRYGYANPIWYKKTTESVLITPAMVQHPSRDCFALQVQDACLGDCLVAPGDTLILNPPSDARDGSIVLVTIYGSGKLDLRLYSDRANWIELAPLYTRTGTLGLSKHDFMVYGVFVGLIRKFNK